MQRISTQRQFEKVSRLEALHGIGKDIPGDAKKLILIEYIDIRVKTAKRIIKRPFYNVLDIKYYNYESIEKEVELVKDTLTKISRLNPLSIHPITKKVDDEVLTLAQKHTNEHNQKYYDYIIKNGIYQKHVDVLNYLKKDIDINNIANFLEARKIVINDIK